MYIYILFNAILLLNIFINLDNLSKEIFGYPIIDNQVINDTLK